MARDEALQNFLDTAFAAYDRFAVDTRSRNSITQMLAQLDTPGTERGTPGKRLPVVDRFLDTALEVTSDDTVLQTLVSRFKALEPQLEWKARPSHDDTASQNFSTSHANVMIVGPAALEHRQDLWIGASLLAPHVRYPDHNHAPEETYLVLSEGDFRQADDEWFSPGIGGSFYNPPDIKHAMRSGDKPLFAFWALLPDRDRH